MRKKHVNTKASQFSTFFGFQELRKKHVNTKTSQFSPFFGFQELRKKHVNTKTSQFSPFFGFQELGKEHVNTKASQFSPFFGFQELTKNMYLYIYIYIYLYCETPKLSFHIGPFFSRRPPQWREGSRSHKARQNKRDLGQGSLAESQDFIWHLKGFEINIGSGASICGGLLRNTPHWSPNKRG